jgi:hypothetical protein
VHSSPLTLALFFVFAGYYIAYSVGVLRKASQLPAPAPATPAPSAESVPVAQ